MKKDDLNLDEMLKSLRVPERSPGYWEYLPKRITARLRGQEESAREPRRAPLFAWAIGLATACLAVGLTLGVWMGGRNAGALNDTQLAESGKLFKEVAALFPNRVQSIVVDATGVHLNLSDNADVPQSPAFLLSICTAGQCRRVITFSGQQIQVNGETCDVLSDASGNVLVVGRSFAWSSATHAKIAGIDRIEAHRLEGQS